MASIVGRRRMPPVRVDDEVLDRQAFDRPASEAAPELALGVRERGARRAILNRELGMDSGVVIVIALLAQTSARRSAR
jgi:hypothetical protein